MFRKNRIQRQIRQLTSENNGIIHQSEALRHLAELLVYLDISKNKYNEMNQMVNQNTYAMAA